MLSFCKAVISPELPLYLILLFVFVFLLSWSVFKTPSFFCMRYVNGYHLWWAVTLEFSKSMISHLCTVPCITKPELFHWKLCLVSQETAVFTPYTVILITVTAKTGVCAWVGYPTCALSIDRCSTPVRHLRRITWHPPSESTVPKNDRAITLILHSVKRLWWDSPTERNSLHCSECHVSSYLDFHNQGP